MKNLIAILLLLPGTLFAQSFRVNLSPKHESKLSTIKSGHKRMMKYYKYYKKDSTLSRRTTDREAKHKMDSALKAEVKGEKMKNALSKRGIKSEKQWPYADSIINELKTLERIIEDPDSDDSVRIVAKEKKQWMMADNVNRELAKGVLPGVRPYKMADDTRRELQRWWSAMKDTTNSDSVRNVAKEKVKGIALEHAMKDPKFQGMYEQYKQSGQKPDWNTLAQQMPGLDTLQGAFDSSPDQLLSAAEGVATQALSKAAGMDTFAKDAGELDDIHALSDPDRLKEQGITALKDQAAGETAAQIEKVNIARKQVSKLLGKYQSFSNSNDLSDAVKRTSLDGKSFKERLVIGGNFNVVSTAPVSIDLAPLVGYKLNTRFYVGVSANYRHTFSDSLKFKWYVSPTNSSLRLFANYDIIKNFFIYTEAERAGIKLKSADTNSSEWKTNYFLGGGKKILVHPKLFMTVTALYNLNGETHNPSHPRKFQIRLGFQSSDLAFRKKKIYYNP